MVQRSRSRQSVAADEQESFEVLNRHACGIDIGAASHYLSLNRPPRANSPQNQPSFDLKHHLYRISGVDFTAIDGMGVLTVQTILSEIGLDPSRFPSAKQFASWLGLSPGMNISGGKRKSSKTRHVSSRAANAFRIAAMAAGKSDSALGTFFRRLKTRLGSPKAITATAHKLARFFYRMWTTTGLYADPGMDYYEQRYQEQILNNLRKKAQSLGFDLIAQPSVTKGIS